MTSSGSSLPRREQQRKLLTLPVRRQQVAFHAAHEERQRLLIDLMVLAMPRRSGDPARKACDGHGVGGDHYSGCVERFGTSCLDCCVRSSLGSEISVTTQAEGRRR